MKSDVVEKTLKYWCGEGSDEKNDVVRRTLLYWGGEDEKEERYIRHSEKRAVMPRDVIGIYVDDVELPVLKPLNDWFENAKYIYAPEFLVLDIIYRVDCVRIPTYKRFVNRVCKVRRFVDYVEGTEISDYFNADIHGGMSKVMKKYMKERKRLEHMLSEKMFELGLLEKDDEHVYLGQKGVEFVGRARDLIKSVEGAPPQEVYHYYVFHYLRNLFKSEKDPEAKSRFGGKMESLKQKMKRWN